MASRTLLYIKDLPPPSRARILSLLSLTTALEAAETLLSSDVMTLSELCKDRTKTSSGKKTASVCNDELLWKSLLADNFDDIFDILGDVDLPNVDTVSKITMEAMEVGLSPWRSLYFEMLTLSINESMRSLLVFVLNNSNLDTNFYADLDIEEFKRILEFYPHLSLGLSMVDTSLYSLAIVHASHPLAELLNKLPLPREYAEIEQLFLLAVKGVKNLPLGKRLLKWRSRTGDYLSLDYLHNLVFEVYTEEENEVSIGISYKGMEEVMIFFMDWIGPRGESLSAFNAYLKTAIEGGANGKLVEELLDWIDHHEARLWNEVNFTNATLSALKVFIDRKIQSKFEIVSTRKIMTALLASTDIELIEYFISPRPDSRRFLVRNLTRDVVNYPYTTVRSTKKYKFANADTARLLLAWRDSEGEALIPTIDTILYAMRDENEDLVRLLISWRGPNEEILDPVDLPPAFGGRQVSEDRPTDPKKRGRIMQLLLDWRNKDGDGMKASDLVSGLLLVDNEYALTFLGLLVAGGYRSEVKIILQDPNTDATFNQDEALLFAVHKNDIETLKALLAWRGKNGKKVNPSSRKGYAKRVATRMGFKKIRSILEAASKEILIENRRKAALARKAITTSSKKIAISSSKTKKEKTSTMSVLQLREALKKAGIKGYSRMRKAELLELYESVASK